ncbi:ABC transporter permease [Rathayibacter sp. VKM Ac-2835]|uniref:ABC transporter permease n=1 Tax=Rathayibacter sp. VKM Ac-2835 TaxID=2739043 RepID=UPI0015646C59|nr:ABC transporter permease [Rathayibacter sp. VKM Ac-2835]NRG41032.1 ABC transporter permease [Rathayibacter sp. VKM Ac-2835]
MSTATDPPARAEPRPANSVRQVLVALLLPLFFVVVFPLAFVSALHDPTPNDLPVLVVGPDQIVAPIAEGLDDTAEFSAERTDVVSEARASVEERRVDGSIEITAVPAADPAAAPTFTVTTYVAGAEGRSVSGAVQGAGDQVAAQLGTTATVVDVAPLAAADSLGTGLFYLLTYTSLGAYLVIIVLMQVMPGAPLRIRYAAISIAAVVAPLIVFGLSSIFLGDYGASFGSIAGLLGVNALYVFTVGCAAILIEQFLGKVATFGIMGFVVFLNFPSAGGAGSAAMLPDFWQGVHSVYFGAGALESFRSIVYFDGNGAARWVLQLLAWTFGLMLVTFIVHLSKTVRRQRSELAELHAGARSTEQEPESPAEPESEPERARHARVETYVLDDPQPPSAVEDTSRPSITSGEGVLR